MATRDYIPVTGDDWYQRRRDDNEGRFLRRLGKQAGRGDESGSDTRQGIYCFTPDGQLLAYRNAGQNSAVMRDTLAAGVAAWHNLPPSRRRPGAVEVPGLDRPDQNFTRTPPPGALIVDVTTRQLDRAGGQVCKCTGKPGSGTEAARDHLWITEAEWRAFAPAGANAGDRYPLPATLAQRLLRFHLVDNTRGEPIFWQPREAGGAITLTVIEATEAAVRLRLDGRAALRAPARGRATERGYDASLLGYVTVNRAKPAVERFDVVALGDAWGDHSYGQPEARTDHTPLGVAFTLARGTRPADRVPPQAARNVGEYLGP
jgi:hypothetical protein